MIKIQTFLNVADNSGAVFGLCIKIPINRIGAIPGDIVKITIKKSRKKKFLKKTKEIKKGQLYSALLVRTIRGLKRWANFYLKMNSNSVVLINQYYMPISTRLFGPIYNEIKENIKFSKIISLSQMIL